MKKRLFIILLAVIALILSLSVFVACDPDDPHTDPPAPTKYTITFDTKGGDAIESIQAEAGADISNLLPADPSKKGVLFGGWSKSDAGFSSAVEQLPATMPSENVTYYARWVVKFTLVPLLQDLDEVTGLPSQTEYTPDRNLAQTFEADPQNPNIDLYDYRLDIVGFEDGATEQEHSVTVGQQTTQEVQLKYNRKAYTFSFNKNAETVSGEMNSFTAYFGQKLDLPEFAYNVSDDLRFAGWATATDGSNFFTEDSSPEIGAEGSPIDGQQTAVTLYAVYDKGYFDFSNATDYVFILAHEEGVAIVRRGSSGDYGADDDSELIELRGTYTANKSLTAANPYLGSFTIPTESGIPLEGRVYADGHFAYLKGSLDSSLFTYPHYPIYDAYDDEILAGTDLYLIDNYGNASLTLTQTIVRYAVAEDYNTVAVELTPGTYDGGYWIDTMTGDYCFSTICESDHGDVQVDVHFKFLMSGGSIVVGLRDMQAGLYVERIEGSRLMGALLMIDGYGVAEFFDEDDVEWSGGYGLVDENTLLLMLASDDDTLNLLAIIDMNEILSYNALYMPIMLYKLGDVELLANYKNADNSTFVADGLGNGVYTDKDGNRYEGTVTIGGELFVDSDSAVAYHLKLADGTVWTIIVNRSSDSAASGSLGFIPLKGEFEPQYLYSTSKNTDEYTGAIIKTSATSAYYLSASYTSTGTLFTDPVSGKLTAQNDSFLFEGGNFVFSYKEDAALTKENGIPTISTAQTKLNAITFTVKDEKGEAAGEFKIEASGATYAVEGGGFANQPYEYAYGSIIVEGQGLYIVDDFTTPVIYLTSKHTITIADEKDPLGEIYEFYGGIMFWAYYEAELRFLAYGQKLDASSISDGIDTVNGRNKNVTFFSLSTSQSAFAAISSGNDYIAANSDALENGTFTNGNDKLTLDVFGQAKYTVAGATAGENKEYLGTYGLEDGVYKVTFSGNSPESFTFAVRGTAFDKVSYKEFFVLNASSLRIVNLLRINPDLTASLFDASESNGTVTYDSRNVTQGVVAEAEGNEGVYTFTSTDGKVAFSFYYNETIRSLKVICKGDSQNLRSGEFSTADGKSIVVDDLGRAKYTEGEKQYDGYYYLNGNLFRFRDTEQDIEVNFTLGSGEQSGKLYIYDANEKPFDGGKYTLTLAGAEYELTITKDGNGYKASLTAAGGAEAIYVGECARDDDGIFTYQYKLSSDSETKSLKFIIADGELVQYDSNLDFTRRILTGSIALYELGVISIDGQQLVRDAGTLTVKGFMRVAELKTAAGTTYKGRIERKAISGEEGYLFTSDSGSTQQLISKGEGDDAYFAAIGSEEGNAYYYYVTIGGISGSAIVNFDGLGIAVDGEHTGVTLYYYMAQLSPSDSTTYIFVGTLDAQADNTFDIVDIYKPYQLATTSNGVVEYIMGVVKYNPEEAITVQSDDGGLFILDGFDEMYFFDSLGMAHSGYYNNYGMMVNGQSDETFIVTDEFENLTLYYFHLDKVENGIVKAHRISYSVFVPSEYESVLYAEVQFLTKDEYSGQLPEGMEGYATLIVATEDNQEGEEYSGFYKFEDGALVITVDGKEIKLYLHIEGYADWENIDEWFTATTD